MKKDNKDIIIRETKLVKVVDIGPNSSLCYGQTELTVALVEFDFVKTLNCVVDDLQNNAIDIEDGSVYHIIQKGSDNRILKSEKLVPGELYALGLKEKNWNKISFIYGMAIKDRARRVYEQYLNNYSFETKDGIQKVKTIGQKNFKKEK